MDYGEPFYFRTRHHRYIVEEPSQVLAIHGSLYSAADIGNVPLLLCTNHKILPMA